MLLSARCSIKQKQYVFLHQKMYLLLFKKILYLLYSVPGLTESFVIPNLIQKMLYAVIIVPVVDCRLGLGWQVNGGGGGAFG